MSFVVTLEDYTPSRRYDSLPWITAKIEEASSSGGPWSLIETITLNPVDTDPSHPRTRNFTTANATLSAGWYRVTFVDAGARIQVADPVSRGTYLVSLERLKATQNIQVNDTTHDLRLTDALAATSLMILNYTDRDFGAPLVTETRTYPYDGTGILDIDDAVTVTDVTITYPAAIPYPLSSLDWYAEPLAKQQGVYEWLVVPQGAPYGGPSPAMGFKNNLDTYVPLLTQPTTVAVTATFGWPNVPADVAEAALLIASELYARPTGDLQAHAIESFSESFVAPQAGVLQSAIPSKAKDILDFYRRVPI